MDRREREEKESQVQLKRLKWKAQRVLDILFDRPVYFKDGSKLVLEPYGHGGGTYKVSSNDESPHMTVFLQFGWDYDKIDWDKTDERANLPTERR
jgi:hypothetical protein